VDGNIQLTQQKTGRVVPIPLAPIARAIIEKEQQTPKGSRVLSNFQNGEVFKVPTHQVMNAIVGCWAKKAGLIKNISFHWARHTFATMALTYGVDIYTVSKLLGHTKVDTTAVYARVIDSRKQEAVGMLPGIGEPT